MMKWQTIENAPKDGTNVLLFIPEFKRNVWIGYWVNDQRMKYGEVTDHLQFWSVGAWALGGGEAKPTHWMPLPTAP